MSPDLRCQEFADLVDGSLGQLCLTRCRAAADVPRIHGAPEGPATRVAVRDVLGLGANEEMRWIAATGDIAGVPNDFVGRNGTDCELVRSAMRATVTVAILVDAAGPQPAAILTVRPLELRPKTPGGIRALEIDLARLAAAAGMRASGRTISAAVDTGTR